MGCPFWWGESLFRFKGRPFADRGRTLTPENFIDPGVVTRKDYTQRMAYAIRERSACILPSIFFFLKIGNTKL